MEGVLSPKESAKLIAETSKDVSVKGTGIEAVAKLMFQKIKEDSFNIQSWKKDHELNPQKVDMAALDWVFVADTLNFSFWSGDANKKYMVKYKGKEYTGYWSWCAALNRALDNGIRITSADFFASISKEELKDILKSDSDYEIPMLDERLEVLQEAGKVLMKYKGEVILIEEKPYSTTIGRVRSFPPAFQIWAMRFAKDVECTLKYNGQFSNVIEKCEKSAQSLLKLIVTDFPSYRDTAEYNGKKVSFYKRAQILIADIWSCFEGKSYGEFHDIDTITMFADYRIPQSLVYFGAMEYTDELMNYLKKDTMMKSGDRYEMEIRGCSIWATEMIHKQTKQMLDDHNETKDALVNSILIDHILWDFRRDNNDKMPHIPFHKVRCIYY